MVAAQEYDLDDGAEPLLHRHFAVVSQAANFGNARDARRLFDRVRKAQSQRLRRLGGMPGLSELRRLRLDDVTAAVS
ncbi:hypothetical protein [Kribbella aluminosa]|nr:hypothetical protein [Kribbella aluminosa]